MDLKKFIGWNRIDGIGFHCHTVFSLNHFHRCGPGQDIGHMAYVARVQMLDHDKSRTTIGWHCGEKFSQRIQAAGRGADADNC
jgi:hypothetical protein